MRLLKIEHNQNCGHIEVEVERGIGRNFVLHFHEDDFEERGKITGTRDEVKVLTWIREKLDEGESLESIIDVYFD